MLHAIRGTFLCIFLTLFGLGCTAGVEPLTPAGRHVTIRKAEPPSGYVEVGPVSGVSGSGCGMYGSKGNYEGAYNALRNRAGEMGAHFVRIDIAEAPGQRALDCYDNTYTLRGVAYKRPSS